MKNNFTLFVAALLLMFAATTVRAQQPIQSGVTASEAIPTNGVSTNFDFTKSATQPSSAPTSALGNTKAFSYFDTKLPYLDWYGHGLYSPYITLFLGERITLSTSTGFVDSVTVQIDSINQDSVFVDLLPDTIRSFTSASVPLHVLNIYNTSAPRYGRAAIQASQVHGPSTITVYYPHVPVPKEFIVTLSPTISATQFTNYFFLRGDIEPVVPLNTVDDRAVWLGQVQSTGQTINYIMDSVFNDGTKWLYTNFYITAYVEEVADAVSLGQATNTALQVYPNPSTSSVTVTLPTSDPSARLVVLDQLGRTVADLTASIRQAKQIKLETARLPAGVYHLQLQNSVGVTNRAFSVVH
jgi:hypothetical protein